MKKLKTTVLLTARGNNTLSRKHLISVNGTKLIEYPLSILKEVKDIDSYYISSDDDEILSIAKKYEYKTIKRSKESAKPDAQHIECIIEALDNMKNNYNDIPDILIVVLGNTVYFKPEWIEESVRLIKEKEEISAVVPVYMEQDHHPYRAKKIGSDGYLENYFDLKGVSTNRQDLPKNYFLCHNFWVLNIEKSIKEADNGQPPWSFMGNKIFPLILDGHMDVHTMEDIELCEKWVEKNNIKIEKR